MNQLNYLPELFLFNRANPDRSSSAANEIFKSVFHDDIKR